MKKTLSALFAALLLTSCAGVHVTQTRVASGAANPRAIYIRPFSVAETVLKGNHGDPGSKPIRKSLAGVDFAEILKEDLETLAPAMVLKEDEFPRHGWLVTGEMEWVHGGSPYERLFFLPGSG